LSAVNGLIRTGEGVSVDGDIETVNGAVELGAGSEVSGEVTTANGSIELDQTVVKRDVRTVNGDIKLRDNSVVKGDLVIRDNMGVSTRNRSIHIEVIGGSIIEGDILVKRDVDVRLILSDGGKVLGQVDGIEVIDQNVTQPVLDDN